MSAATLPGDHRRPHLTLEELQQLKWVLGALLTLIAASTVFYMDIDAWTLMAVTTVAAVATLLRPRLPARVPALLHTLAFPGIVAFFAADLWLRTEILPAMVRLDILLLLYRSITYRQRRDDLQIIILGLFLIVVAGVLSVSLTFAAHILIYTACALALLLVVTLTDAAGGAGPRLPVPFGETPGWALHADWGHLARRLRAVTDWRVVGLGVVLFAGVVAVSALLFLAIPRFQLDNSMFLDRFISKKAKTGFNDSIRFGDVTDIQQDNALALSVDVSDQSQIPSSPYWRMLVLDEYSNGTFRLSPALRAQQFGNERSFSFVHGEARPKTGPAVQWTFYLESGVSRYLPLLGQFEILRFREVQNFRLAPYLAVVQLRDEPVTMTAYRVEGFELGPSLSDPVFARRWATRDRARRQQAQAALQLEAESDTAALRRIVQEVQGDRTLPAGEFARGASAWLKQHHAYSLSPNIPRGDGDPLVRWLVSREGGHCELFAGSMVLLARTAGLPARVVTGFRGGSWNGYSNNFTIRNADAHAWAEIFDEAAGAWLRADALATGPAAQAEVQGEAALVSRLDRSWKARLDSLRVFWYRRIVSFDQRSQAETLKAMKVATENSGRRLRAALADFNQAVKAWLAAPWDLERLVRSGASITLALGLLWWFLKYGRGLWRALGTAGRGRGSDPVRLEAGRLLVKFHTMAPAGAAPEVRAELERLRYGARATWPHPPQVFRAARRALREARRPARVTRS
jgi:protein-glutamine gamma-glutamyltransferase